jgi:hypothetical protein
LQRPKKTTGTKTHYVGKAMDDPVKKRLSITTLFLRQYLTHGFDKKKRDKAHNKRLYRNLPYSRLL